jgi:hypothetical protein
LKKVETLELVHEDRVREKPDGASEREEVLDPIKQSLVVDARQGTDTGQAIGEEDVTVEEKEFIRLLNVELEKFNSFFTEKEEDYVIQLQVKCSFCRPLSSLVCSRISAKADRPCNHRHCIFSY